MIRSLASIAARYTKSLALPRSGATRASSTISTGKDRFFPATELGDLISRKKSSSTDGGSGYEKVAFLGAGKMAQAIISPLINTSLMPAEKVAVFDVSVSQMKEVEAKHEGIHVAQSIPELVDGADLVVCAVKPQNINEGFFKEFQRSNVSDDATFLSVIAGIPLDHYYGTGFKKIVRSMPNTPAMIG